MPDEHTPYAKPTPHLNAAAQAEAVARRAREAVALRENLHRRKAQVRARKQASGPEVADIVESTS